MENKRDFWSKLQVISGILASVLIPLVIFWIGTEMNRRQAERDRYQQNADRVTTIIKSLSSENPRERKMALSFADYLAQSGQFPEELFPVFLSIINTDPNREVAEEATQVLQEAATRNVKLERSLNEVLTEMKPVVYIQYTRPEMRSKALELQQLFKENRLNAPGIELVMEARVRNNQLRYFSNEAEVIEIRNMIHELMMEHVGETEMMDLSETYESANPMSFEVWLE